MSIQPLKGIRVLDLSKVLAWPLCGQYLGELGADVIKVEPTGTGDDTRAWLPQLQGQSATFLAVNHNKRSIADFFTQHVLVTMQIRSMSDKAVRDS